MADGETQLRVIDRLEAFFCSPQFTCAVGDFMRENGERVELVGPDEEQPPVNMEVFRAYCDLVEKSLEEHLQAEGLSQQAVLDACRSEQGGGDAARFACVEYLLASTEYGAFMQLVADHARMAQYDCSAALAAGPGALANLDEPGGLDGSLEG
eukprot:TRINITY_DN30628_c0_g1_i1.p1 TRINITY_DN30628_c0_g1~~TRINITY_DN30628_c0_g1_i1.p1  ORF type:complete len:153 (+),score=57.77 TRINITY_DN30628_c0_g1_i1:83-541(+)